MYNLENANQCRQYWFSNQICKTFEQMFILEIQFHYTKQLNPVQIIILNRERGCALAVSLNYKFLKMLLKIIQKRKIGLCF